MTYLAVSAAVVVGIVAWLSAGVRIIRKVQKEPGPGARAGIWIWLQGSLGNWVDSFDDAGYDGDGRTDHSTTNHEGHGHTHHAPHGDDSHGGFHSDGGFDGGDGH